MVQKGDRVIVGVSGGPDSICLLHLFVTFRSKIGICLYVAHLDHMFRGRESEEDAYFVKDLCKNGMFPLAIKSMYLSMSKNSAFLLKTRHGG